MGLRLELERGLGFRIGLIRVKVAVRVGARVRKTSHRLSRLQVAAAQVKG